MMPAPMRGCKESFMSSPEHRVAVRRGHFLCVAKTFSRYIKSRTIEDVR